ncbi:inositol monophosphatase family protein [uncultured Porticoccus sp.]|uniref:inositol monophosphatase family protein n=1 Tax=uncultured Porticoccus sp. TaxID=1256050 RepID=UPI002610424F|nr:inositol monophosphatase family protein [uncultured Porticoccus sp.]
MEPMVNIALRAARKAGEMIARATERVDLIRIDEKGRNDFVTEIDHAAEKEIIYHLRKAFPDHTILGEESGLLEGDNNDYQWIIDPLDGTTNFIHGIPHFAVSIGCRHKGRLEHGVVFDPMRLEEFTASRGHGAFLNGKRLRVSGRVGLAGAVVATGIPFNQPSIAFMEPYLACLSDLAKESSGIRRLGVASLDLAYLAAGRFDAFWEMNLKPWDIAAGVLLVKEAGGLVSDFRGGNGFMESGNIVCASPKLFKPTLQLVQKHLGFLEKPTTA